MICAPDFSAKAIPHPVAETTVGLGLDYAHTMRRFRQYHASLGHDAGFSIFTNRPFQSAHALKGDAAMTIQCWDDHAPRVYGLTNLMRVMNGYRDRPYDWPAANARARLR